MEGGVRCYHTALYSWRWLREVGGSLPVESRRAFKEVASEGHKESKENDISSLGMGDPCYDAAENLTMLLPVGRSRLENVQDKFDDLDKDF